MVFDFHGGTEAEVFEAFQAVNDLYAEKQERDDVNIALVPISVSQLDDWIENNIEPNWWQNLTRRVRYTVTKMARE
jgi:hypothetical protein